jgi:hypothetical protein
MQFIRSRYQWARPMVLTICLLGNAVGLGSDSLSADTDARMTAGRLTNAACCCVMSSDGAPGARSLHSAVWTGTEMIVWGGVQGSTVSGDGGRYDPASDTWRSISMVNAPSPRYQHAAAWTGTEMIIWGGVRTENLRSFYLNDGARYNPDFDIWVPIADAPLSADNAPSDRWDHSGVWAGDVFIIWGGVWIGARGDPGTGFRRDASTYDPRADIWTPIQAEEIPESRRLHTAVWTGQEMLIWGGAGGSNTVYDDGVRYAPLGCHA